MRIATTAHELLCRCGVRMILLVALCCGVPAFAQSTAGALAAPPSPRVAPEQDFRDTLLDLFGPAAPGPLQPGQQFRQYLFNTAGPVALAGEAAGAGIGQWTNSPKEWGQGWGAFGKRYGSNLAYNGVRQTLQYGTAVVFHEDYRYFAATRHGFWNRTKHALVATFTARHPDGTDRFSVSSVVGVVGASSISSVWGPESWKHADGIAANAGISFASTAGVNVVREFLPDLLHRK